MYSLQFATALELIQHDIILQIYPLSDIVDFVTYIDRTLKHHPILNDHSVRLIYRHLCKRRTFYNIIVSQNDLDEYLISKDKLFFNMTSKQHALCLKVLMMDGNMLKFIPKMTNSKILYATALAQNGLSLEFVPVDLRDKDLCKIAVNNNAFALSYVPDVNRNDDSYMYELYRIALNRDPFNAIILIPIHHRTEELSIVAVSFNGMMLEHVPGQIKCLKIYEIALTNNGLALQFVNVADIDERLCHIAVSQNGLALQFAPFQTESIRIAALQQNGNALRYIPENDRQVHLCHTAVDNTGDALRWVPSNRFVPYIIETALSNDGTALRFVHHDYRNNKMCLLAVLNDGSALQYVPFDKMTDDIIKIAIEQNPLALELVPENKKTLIICKKAVEKNGWTIQFVPNDKKTEYICEKAVSQIPRTLQFIPNSKRTEKIIMSALSIDIDCVFILDSIDFTRNISKYIISQKPEMIHLIPQNLRTLDLFYSVVSKYPSIVKHVTSDDTDWKLFTYVAISIDPYVFWSIDGSIRDITHTMLFVQLDKINKMYFSKDDREIIRNRLNAPGIIENISIFERVSKNPKSFRNIPIQKITITLCRIAVYLDGMNIKWLPTSGITEDIRKQFYMIAAEQNHNALRFIPYDVINDDFYQKIREYEEFSNTYTSLINDDED